MKNYLILIKEALMKKKKAYTKKAEDIESQSLNMSDDYQKIINISNILGLDLAMHNLKRLPSEGINRYNVSYDNMIYLYPPNDGMPTCPFEFYKDGKLIISNKDAYTNITNLDEIILQIVKIYNKSLYENIVIDPYYFMLKLNGEVKENYRGNATLVITEKAIRNQKLNGQNFDEANKYFINRFLDHFIGWNFGVSVNRNEILRRELEILNEKVINMGIREYAGTGFEVYGVENESCHGLQHYYLPTKKVIKK